MLDSLIVIGFAVVSLGTIQESDGMQERKFWLRNVGTEAVSLVQGYTSCHCTTIGFPKDSVVASGDSTYVTLRFNPQGKGGDFYESGTVVYGDNRKRLTLALEGTCITSEETLLRQFPISINERLRLSSNRFDLGHMHVGEKKERNVVILHRDSNLQERITIGFVPDENTPKGLQHVVRRINIADGEEAISVDIILDVIVK